jgi:hypothetical protein
MMWRELALRFVDREPEPGEDDVVAIFRPSGPHIGALRVLVNRWGVIVDVEGWSHKHIDFSTPEQTVEQTANYLDDLFADQIVEFRTPSERVTGGFPRDNPPSGWDPDGGQLPADTEFTTWTAPMDASSTWTAPMDAP